MVAPDQGDEFAEELGQVDGVERQLGVGQDHLADVAAELAEVDLVSADLQVVEGPHHAVGVLGHEPEQEVGDPLAGRQIHLAEEAVIKLGNHPAGKDPEVPRVRVGVEESIGEDLLGQERAPPGGDILRVDPDPTDTVQVVDVDPVDPLHRQDLAGREGVNRLGDVGEGLVDELEPATLHRPALGVQVEFSLEVPLELLGQRDRPGGGQPGEPTLGHVGEVPEDVEVGLHDLLDPRPPNLQDDRSAIGQGRGMDLGDRGRGQGLRVDPGEKGIGRAEFLAENRLGLLEREGADLVPEEAQLLDIGVWQEVRPGAEQLAELHEGRPEILADHPEPLGAVGRRDVLMAERDVLQWADKPLDMDGRDDVLIAVADQGRQDLPVPGDVSEVADGFSEHRAIRLLRKGIGGRVRLEPSSWGRYALNSGPIDEGRPRRRICESRC